MASETAPGPLAQDQYEVRFDWGMPGAASVVPGTGVIVLVDPLATATPMVETGSSADLPAALGTFGIPVLEGSLRNRTAVAQWILDRQTRLGTRIRVAVIAAGATRADGSIRFSVEDQLTAGAVVDALAVVGIDYCSPEAAAACAVFTTLQRAADHLFTASASGQELIAGGARAEVERAAELDVSDAVVVLGELASSS
ncbi:MAG: 2-phosphosulfolactate phosphatase [Microbacteriaceae bacterium]